MSNGADADRAAKLVQLEALAAELARKRTGWPHRVDKRMTPAQFRDAIAGLGLSQERAARWLGINPRAAESYALGECPIPQPTAMLLSLVIKLGLRPEDVE
jgi:hypothetical protein